MEPNKWEEDFRKQLNSREIQPSGAAWDRLDAMLSVGEKNTPKRKTPWLYIAAGFAVFFTVGLFLFHQEKESKGVQYGKETIVESETKKDDSSSNMIQSEPVSKSNGMTVHHKDDRYVAISNKVAKRKTESVKQSVTAQESISQEPKSIVVQEEIAVNSVSSETDALLSKEKSTLKVNANSLLSTVEGELNQEFRETTLQKLNRNFKTVRTVVANRNYE